MTRTGNPAHYARSRRVRPPTTLPAVGDGSILGSMGSEDTRPATLADVYALAEAMPHVTRLDGSQGKPIYQVGSRSFIFFRNPRPDAADPVTGERYDDVIVFWVESEADKQSLVDDPDTPFFTTDHFNGHLSVLVRARDLPALSYRELSEVIQDAWLSRASRARATEWLKSRGLGPND